MKKCLTAFINGTHWYKFQQYKNDMVLNEMKARWIKMNYKKPITILRKQSNISILVWDLQNMWRKLTKKKKYIIYIKEKGVLVKYQTPTVVTILLLLPHYQPLLLEILVSLYCGETGAYFFSSRALKNKSSTECTSNIKKFKYFIFCNHFAKVIPQVLSSVPIFFPILFDRKG